MDLPLALSLVNDQRFKQRCRRYGVTIAEAVQAYEQQERSCAICAQTAEDIRDLVFDHNHITGTFRGLLCGKCNTGIGLLGDSLITIAGATTYLSDRGSYGRRHLKDGRTEEDALVFLQSLDYRAIVQAHLPKDEWVKAGEHRKYHRIKLWLGIRGDCRLCVARDATACLDDCNVCAARNSAA